MATSIPVPPLKPLIIHQHRTRTRTRTTSTRFLISRNNKKNFPHKSSWIINNNINNASVPHRLPSLFNPHSHYFHSSLSICSCLNISYPPLCSVFGSRLPRFRSCLSSMTKPPQAAQDPPPPPQSLSSPTKTVRVMIKGRVQGVFYRDWTVENATQLGLKGWVRNRRDGSVEALFSGNPDSVQEMEQRCRRGPSDAMVTRLEVFPCSDDPGTGFERKPTV